MKKFLAILLIALIVCEVIPEEQALKERAGKLEDLLSLIKKSGIYNEMKRLLNTTGGKVAAVAACIALGGPLVYLCNDVIGLIK